MPKKTLKILRSYPAKENHIGSAVSKILRYTQTDRDYKDDELSYLSFKHVLIKTRNPLAAR